MPSMHPHPVRTPSAAGASPGRGLRARAAGITLAALLSGVAACSEGPATAATAPLAPDAAATVGAGADAPPPGAPDAGSAAPPPEPAVPAPGEERLAGLPAASGPLSHGARQGPAPEAVAELLRALPGDGLPLTRRELRALADDALWQVETRDGGVLAFDQPGARFGLWLRSFPDASGATGYLLQLRVPCEGDRARGNRDAAVGCGPDEAFADSGLRAYRMEADGTVHDLTGTLALPRIETGAARALRDAGAGEAYLDDSRLVLAPTARWVMDSDPDRHPPHTGRAIEGGTRVHIAFVVWADGRFEMKEEVPPELWPCPAGERCTDDRFVLAAKAPAP